MKLGPVEIRGSQPAPPNGNRSLGEVLAGYDVLEVGPGGEYVVAAKQLQTPLTTDQPPILQELGSSATRYRRVLGGEEYNSELAGYSGLVVYDRMRRSDAGVKQSLRIAKTPVLQGRWWVDSADPDDPFHNQIAEFIDMALFKWMTTSWTQVLIEALLMLDFGYYMFEKVFDYTEWNGAERLIWKKWSPRHPMDVSEWEYDSHGGPEGVEMEDFEGEEPVWLPIRKLLVFTFDREAGNMEGISLLRSAYKHWYYKENLYKIDAIQKERHGIGIPVIKLPPNWSVKDKTLAEELGRNLRTNEQAHVVLPPMWELEFAEVKGQPVDVIKSIEHHDMQLSRNVLAAFVGTDTSAAAEVQVEMFLKASRFIADIVREVVNKHAIPELVNWNWMGVDKYPELKVRRIGEVTDLRTLSFMIRNLISVGALTADDELEVFLREESDMPRRDESTSREPIKGTRQSPTAPSGPASPNAGRDASGG